MRGYRCSAIRNGPEEEPVVTAHGHRSRATRVINAREGMDSTTKHSAPVCVCVESPRATNCAQLNGSQERNENQPNLCPPSSLLFQAQLARAPTLDALRHALVTAMTASERLAGISKQSSGMPALAVRPGSVWLRENPVGETLQTKTGLPSDSLTQQLHSSASNCTVCREPESCQHGDFSAARQTSNASVRQVH